MFYIINSILRTHLTSCSAKASAPAKKSWSQKYRISYKRY
nr:MAG TPA: hypothetical protein [Caudoviricetes sp.]